MFQYKNKSFRYFKNILTPYVAVNMLDKAFGKDADF